MDALDSALVVGDAHGSTAYLATACELAARLEYRAVLVVGDFGYWAADARICTAAARAEAEWGIPVGFLDGNHEHHPRLAAAVTAATGTTAPPAGPIRLEGSLWYLARGARLTLAGRSAVAIGGAHSIDRAARVPGSTWFPEEVPSDAELARAVAGGPAEILLCHDAPAGWEIPGLYPREQLSAAWHAELPACDAARDRLAVAYRALEPRLVVHGHYHSGYRLDRAEAWGAVRVVGLDCDRPGWAWDSADGPAHPSMVGVRGAAGALVLDAVPV